MAAGVQAYSPCHPLRATRKAPAMTSVVHNVSHSSLAQCAAAGAALLTETHGVRVTGSDLEIWTANAPVDAVQGALNHVESIWRGRKERALELHAAANKAQMKVTRARSMSAKTRALEICEVAWSDYSRACTETDAAESRIEALRSLLA